MRERERERERGREGVEEVESSKGQTALLKDL